MASDAYSRAFAYPHGGVVILEYSLYKGIITCTRIGASQSNPKHTVYIDSFINFPRAVHCRASCGHVTSQLTMVSDAYSRAFACRRRGGGG